MILQAMREAYDAQGAAAAVPFAKDAAPYMHARISATELSGPERGPVQVERSVEYTKAEVALFLARHTPKLGVTE